MKVCFAVPLGMILLFAVACGGAAQRSQATPSVASTNQTHAPTPAQRTDMCPSEPETVNGYQDEDGCPDSSPALTSEPIVFTGWTIQGPTVQQGIGEGSHWWRLEVNIEHVLKDDGSRYFFDLAAGEKMTVLFLQDDPPPTTVGDFVQIGGRVSRYACGATCDAAGFIAAPW